MKTSYVDPSSPSYQYEDWEEYNWEAGQLWESEDNWEEEAPPLESRFQHINKESSSRRAKKKHREDYVGPPNRIRPSFKKKKRQRSRNHKYYDGDLDDE